MSDNTPAIYFNELVPIVALVLVNKTKGMHGFMGGFSSCFASLAERNRLFPAVFAHIAPTSAQIGIVEIIGRGFLAWLELGLKFWLTNYDSFKN